ncbi:MAG: hypothetical protein AB7P01_04425 [Bacteroidia bacterium]
MSIFKLKLVSLFKNAIFLFALFFFCNNQQAVAQKTYDLPAIIEYFTLDVNDVATIQSWDFGTETDSPVKWSDAQLQWDETSSTYLKHGTVLITVDGVPTTFNVILSGTKIVVNRVQLNLSKSAAVPVFELERILNAGGIKTVYLKCDNVMPKSYGTLAYSLFMPNKKEAWVAYSWQCLKGECSANINIYYEKDKVEKLPCY